MSRQLLVVPEQPAEDLEALGVVASAEAAEAVGEAQQDPRSA